MKKLVLGLVMALMLCIGMLAGTLLTRAAQAQGNPPKAMPMCACQAQGGRFQVITLMPLEGSEIRAILLDSETGDSWYLSHRTSRWHSLPR